MHNLGVLGVMILQTCAISPMTLVYYYEVENLTTEMGDE